MTTQCHRNNCTNTAPDNPQTILPICNNCLQALPSYNPTQHK